MAEIVDIHRKRKFTLSEARELLPVVRRFTRAVESQVAQLTARHALVTDNSVRQALEDEIQALFRGWCEKLQRLGCEAKGMWLVDFDYGDGFYCWHYPEDSLDHRHGYLEGFRARVKIPDVTH